MQPHDVDHVIPKKVKKELQLQQKKELSSERQRESSVAQETTSKASKSARTPQMKVEHLEKTLKKIKTVKKEAAKKAASEQAPKPHVHEHNGVNATKAKAEPSIPSGTAAPKKVGRGRRVKKTKKVAKTSIKLAKKPPPPLPPAEKPVKKKPGRKKKVREDENKEINQQ